MRFEDAYNEFLKLGTRHLKKQSLESYTKNFNLHILSYFKDKNINELTKIDFINWKNSILDLNFSNSYNNTLYVDFNSFLKFCCEYFDLKNNYLREIGNFKKKYEEKKTDFYNLKEFDQFIKCVDNNIYKQFFNLMFYTGTRPGEAMALKFSDLNNGYISINKNLTTKGGRTLDTPKNQSSIRTIKVDNYLNKELCKLKKYYQSKYNDSITDYFIFGGNKPLAPTTINRYKLKACEKANIRPITLHQFRHSHATLLLNNDVMINEISRRLGHSKVSTTLDIYIHNDLEYEKRVFNTLNFIRFKSYTKNFKTILKHFL